MEKIKSLITKIKLIVDFLVFYIKIVLLKITSLFKKKEKKTLGKPPGVLPQSIPFVISITNTDDVAKQFELFGASKNIRKINDDGNITDGSITIKSEVATIDYNEILWYSALNPFTVGYTQLRFENIETNAKFFPENSSNCGLKFELIKSNPSDGSQYLNNVFIFVDPYQQQPDVKTHRMFNINGFTKMIGHIPAKTKLTIQFYPKKCIDLSYLLYEGASPMESVISNF